MVILLLAALAGVSFAAESLPEDRGLAGLHQAVRRLGNTARVLYITAHPDDEDGGTITWLSRGRGIDVTLLSLTRGESGANLITSDFFDSLGALRTMELAKACQYYGASLRFTHVADYGYSKNVEEAWRNWDRERLLEQVVRVVREERPHVILARWQGTARDGHGHHSAAGVMAQLSFEAAADPSRFPDQIARGLAAWRASKLYSNNRREGDDWTVRVDSGVFDLVLGRSYAQIARDGLRWQRSQGAGSVVSRPGASVTYYKLLASHVGAIPAKETDFFTGIEAAIGTPDAAAREAHEVLQRDPTSLPRVLAKGLVTASSPRLKSKFADALARSLGLELEALVQPDVPITGPAAFFRPYETFQLATPGQKFSVSAALHVRAGVSLDSSRLELVAGPSWRVTSKGEGIFEVGVPDTAPHTKAAWGRESVRQLFYGFDDPAAFGRAVPEPPLIARATYRYAGVESTIESQVLVSRIDSIGVQQLRPLAVGPAISVRFASEFGVLPANRRDYEVDCVVRNLAKGASNGALRIRALQGWSVEPASAPFAFARESEEVTITFRLSASAVAPAGDVSLEAVAVAAGREYRASFVPHTSAGLETLWLERPAVHVIRRVDVKVAPGIRVGYVMGTGDDVPHTIRQLGVPVDLLDSGALATADLSRYSTILLGIRAYAARHDVRVHNARLLDYVKEGGVLVVQYNTPEYDNNYAPFPYTMGRNPEEVSEENSPVRILDPADPVFTAPNRITLADFDGWVEQRGSKFLATWDPRFKPLIETHDTGQAPQEGGWLVARHGKGLYIYCAYAWYRQLPFAVPGAVRLFANLLSLGAHSGQAVAK